MRCEKTDPAETPFTPWCVEVKKSSLQFRGDSFCLLSRHWKLSASFLKMPWGLDAVCEDSTIENKTGNLSLTGLQPCFEDVVLLLPIFVAFIVLSSYRIHQCVGAGKFPRPIADQWTNIVKIFFCVTNLGVSVAALLVHKTLATFELLVWPIAIVGWALALTMVIIEMIYFSYRGQFVPRGLFLWVFICYCIRYDTQQALGGSYFTLFLISFVSQAGLVVLNYFEKYVTFEEFSSLIIAPEGRHLSTAPDLHLLIVHYMRLSSSLHFY